MVKRKSILKATLKALLAGVETSAWVKIPATFISEIASLPTDKRDALDAASAEKFGELLTQAKLSTTKAALAAVGAEQIKVLVANLTQLSKDQSDSLTKLTQQQYEETLNKLDAIHANTEEILKKLEQVSISDTRRAIGAIIHNLPYTSLGDLFKGRGEVLERLKGDLDEDKPTAITQAIHGLGGIGKTRLSVEFAWWAITEGKYRGVFFVNSETPELLHASLASLAAKDVLNLSEQNADQETAELAVFQWLSVHESWLVIFDNADTKESAEVVEALLPHLAAGHVIITSRYTRWSAAVKPQSLGLLKAKDAEQFLLERTANRRTETEQDESNAKKLAKELGFLPLSLEQAAAYISHESMTFADYLTEWEDERKDVLEWHNEREMRYPVSVAVTWQRTFDKLSLASRTVLRLAAFLAPEPVPSVMFEEGKAIVAEAVPLLAKELGKGAESKCDVKKAIGELASYSMIVKKEKTFTIHRIVQEVIRFRIAAENKRDWIEKALRLVNDYAPTKSYDVGTWPILDVLRPHAETIAKSADQAGITEPTARLMSVLDCYFSAKGLYAQAEYFSRRALAIGEASLGKDHPDVAIRLNNLALLYRDTNRLAEAEPLMKRAIEIGEVSFGKDHPSVALRLNNLAGLYKTTNRLPEAEQLYQRALSIRKKSLGTNHPDYATSLNDLANLLGETNRLTEAEPLYDEVIHIYENAFGANHPWVATALNNLAQLYQDTNRLAEAEPLMKRALAIDQASFGKDHPKVAIRLNNLAQLYQATNRYPEAEPLMKRTLAIDQVSFGSDHPNVAIDLNNLAQLYKATNRLKEAEPLMKRALAIDQASFGKDHPNVAIDLNNLAALYRDTNRCPEAEPLMKRAVGIAEKSLGPNHPNTITFRRNLEQLSQ